MKTAFGVCFYCGVRGPVTKDHVIPAILGGPSEPWNIVPACFACNGAKGSLTYEEFTDQPTLPLKSRFATTTLFLEFMERGGDGVPKPRSAARKRKEQRARSKMRASTQRSAAWVADLNGPRPQGGW